MLSVGKRRGFEATRSPSVGALSCSQNSPTIVGDGGQPSAALFYDDFSSYALGSSDFTGQGSSGFSWGGPRNTLIAQAPDGTKCLRFRFEDPATASDWAEQRFFTPSMSEVWVRQRWYITSNYYHPNSGASTYNNKGWLYLWSGDYGVPSGPGMGPNFWPNGDGTSNHTFFVWTGTNPTGSGDLGHLPDSNTPYTGGTAANRSRTIETGDLGVWFTMYFHYKYATSANNDGVAEMWKVSNLGVKTKICEILNGKWYQPGQPGFSNGYILGAANSEFPEPFTDFYLSEIEFADSDIWGVSS